MHRWLVVMLLLTTMALTGCGRSEPDADFIFVSAVDVNTLDPQKMSWNHDIRTAGCLWEPLVRMKLPQLTVEAGVASSWSVSDDGLTYRFNLRTDAKWSNGDPVTARDFITAWRRAILPDFAADYAQLFFCVRGAREFFLARQQQLVEYANGSDKSRPAAEKLWQKTRDDLFASTVGVSAPDNHTLIVELAQPTPCFLELCAFATFMPNHTASMEKLLTVNPATGMLELPMGYWTDPGQLITNGPYQLSRYRFKRDILVTQNPHWWNKGAMQNRSILQLVIENPGTAMLSYDSGQAHWLPDIPTNLTLAADLVQAGRVDVHTTPWAGTYFYSYNCLPSLAGGAANPLADGRVRRALSMGIDRRTLVQNVTRMKQPEAVTFIPPGMLPGYDAPVEAGASFDITEARKLLAEAGYTEGAKLTGLSILFNTGGGHEPVAQAIKHQWQQNLGVTVTLEGLEVKAFRERLKTQQYTIARASWIGDYRDPSTFLDKYESEGGNNDSRYQNAAYDTLLTQARTTADPAGRMKLYRQAETMLLRDQPIAPIYHYLTLDVFDPQRVKGLYLNAWNFRRLELVRVD